MKLYYTLHLLPSTPAGKIQTLRQHKYKEIKMLIFSDILTGQNEISVLFLRTLKLYKTHSFYYFKIGISFATFL